MHRKSPRSWLPCWLAELWRGTWRSHQFRSASVLQERAFSRPAELRSAERGGHNKLLIVDRLRIGIEVRSEELELALRDPRRLYHRDDRPRVVRPIPQLDSCDLKLPLTHVDGELSLEAGLVECEHLGFLGVSRGVALADRDHLRR